MRLRAAFSGLDAGERHQNYDPISLRRGLFSIGEPFVESHEFVALFDGIILAGYHLERGITIESSRLSSSFDSPNPYNGPKSPMQLFFLSK